MEFTKLQTEASLLIDVCQSKTRPLPPRRGKEESFQDGTGCIGKRTTLIAVSPEVGGTSLLLIVFP